MASSRTRLEQSVQIRTLPNGITVMLEALPYLHSVSAGMWIRVGSAHETAEQNGISHFLEHELFKGTSTRSAREIVEPIERHGGHINAYTTRDYTCLYVKVLSDHLASALEVMGDVLKDTQLIDVDKERNVILEEIATADDVPEDRIHDLFSLRLWPNHPLGRPIAGDLKTVSAIGRDDLRAFYERHYSPKNMVFAAAGNFDPEALYETVARLFSDLERGEAQHAVAEPSPGAGIELATRDIAQHHITLGFPGVSVSEQERFVFDMLSSALGGGSTSRLFERVREQEGLAYAIYTFHQPYSVRGMFGLYAAVAPENLDRCLEVCFEELRRIREQPLDAEELALNCEQLKGGLLIGLENTSNRVSRMAKSMLTHGRLVSVEETIGKVESVTAERIRELADSLFREDRCVMALLGPEPKSNVARVRL